MAGIIKRNNKWVAVFRSLDGKELRKTTGIDVVPKALLPGANKKSVMSQNEARARLVAQEMEKEARYGVFDLDKVKAIAGDQAGVLKATMNGMTVTRFLLTGWTGGKTRSGPMSGTAWPSAGFWRSWGTGGICRLPP